MAPDLVDRLAEHRTLKGAPREQLQWLAEHGHLMTVPAGDVLSDKTGPVLGLYIVLSGHLSIHIDRGTGPHRVMEWRGGDVTGALPYSRIGAPPGDVTAEEPSELLMIPREDLPRLARECQEVTSILVHVMLDRARAFTSNDLYDEKMQSLGKLAAGLAHELNNPASAVARSAEALGDRLTDVETAALALGTCGLSKAQRVAIERSRQLCHTPSNVSAMSRADREEAIADWLEGHDVDAEAAEVLVDSAITAEALDELAAALGAETLPAGLRWLMADCAASQLAAEIHGAASKIHELVAAVKGFTYMDQAAMPKPVDVGRGLADTLAVLKAKAKTRGIEVSVDVAPDLPRIQALGGALNQVWANLIDNALDAAKTRVRVAAARQGPVVLVTVTDDGAGIPAETQERIFDPFFTTKPQGEGMGLGLDIVRRIVRQHRGDLELDSRPGQTVFSVTLPVDQRGL